MGVDDVRKLAADLRLLVESDDDYVDDAMTMSCAVDLLDALDQLLPHGSMVVSREDQARALWFTASALREHVEGAELTGQPDVLEGVSDTDLEIATDRALSRSDYLWDVYDQECGTIIELAKQEAEDPA